MRWHGRNHHSQAEFKKGGPLKGGPSFIAEPICGLVALGVMSLAIVARVGRGRLTADVRRRLHLLELRRVELRKTLFVLKGERLLLDRHQASATLDRAAAYEAVE